MATLVRLFFGNLEILDNSGNNKMTSYTTKDCSGNNDFLATSGNSDMTSDVSDDFFLATLPFT